jgi:hypothetical protein
MTHTEFNEIYFNEADKVLRKQGFWRQNSHYVKQNETEFFIINKNTKRNLFLGFTFVFCHTFMKNLDGEYPSKIMIPEVSPFVFNPTEFQDLMQNKNGMNHYVYDYERITGITGDSIIPFEFDNLTKEQAQQYIQTILEIAINDGLTFLKKLKPEFTLYQLKEFGKDLWIEKKWISEIEKYISDIKNVG